MKENEGASTIFASALLPSCAEITGYGSGMALYCESATIMKRLGMPLQLLALFMKA
jgi:hypothetical protein